MICGCVFQNVEGDKSSTSSTPKVTSHFSSAYYNSTCFGVNKKPGSDTLVKAIKKGGIISNL